jgi:DNA-binding transcriptional MerR regulator
VLVEWLVTVRAGELASAAGVNRETLRYYERRGLLARPDRSPGGHRLYPPEALTRLRVVKAAQRLGFTLDEVADLLRAGRRRGRDQGLQVRAREKLEEVERRIADLSTIRDNLVATLAMGCDDLHECATQECCPVPFGDLATG